MSAHELALHWHGPYGVGYFPPDIEGLKSVKGLYILHYWYDASKKDVFYVGSVTGTGKGRSIHTRLREHYNGILGFGYWLRDEQGEWDRATNPDTHAFARLDDLDRSLEIAAREARRMRFYYAGIENAGLDLVLQAESLLIVYLRDKAKQTVDNDRLPVARQRLDLKVLNSFSHLETRLSELLPTEINASSLLQNLR